VANWKNRWRLAGATATITALTLAAGAAAQPATNDADSPPELEEGEVWFGQFAEPVDLQALVDFVSRELGVNIIISDTGLATQQVVFRAPMKVTNQQLLSLLGLFLSQSGYALSRDPEHGWYMVTQVGNLPVNLGDEDAMATTVVFPTPLVRPSAVKTALEQALGTTGGGGGAGAAGGRRLTPVDELGVLISTAPARENQQIGRLIDLILSGSKDQRLQRFDFNFIAASEGRDRMLELIGQGGGGQQRGGQAQGQAQQGVVSGSLSNLADRLVLDRQGNALYFRGDDSESEEVRRLVDLVDSRSRLIVRRYQAGAMSQRIASIGSTLGLGPIGGGGPAGGGGGRGAGGAAPSVVGSRFELDGGDEALAFTYFGTAAQHEQVQELIDEFAEERRLDEFRVEFYKLRYATADDVANLLEQLLEIEPTGDQQDSPFLPQGLTTEPRNINRVGPAPGEAQQAGPDVAVDVGAPADEVTGLTPAEGITVIPDDGNNQVIIRAPARQQQEFARIIERLDERKPQVYIEAQIVSVNSSNDFSWNIDFAIDPGNENAFQGLADLSTYTFLGGASTLIIDSDDVPVIINTMLTEGEGRIVSTPRVLVNDNESAEISSEREEPFSTTSQVAGAPSQTSLGGTLNAGTTLTIEPQISDRGFIILDVQVSLSSFGERPNPDLPPVRLSDNISSVVTLPSETTVVIGGLTFKQENESISKIPLLGDIPILGNLFRDISIENSNQTIYVFITPRVLRDPTFSDLRLITEGPLSDTVATRQLPPLEPAMMQLFGAPEWEEKAKWGEGPASSESGEASLMDTGAAAAPQATPATRANDEAS